MLFGNPALYAKARQAKLSGRHLEGPLGRLSDWICVQYSVNVLHVELDAIEIGPRKRHPRLTVIVESRADYRTLHKDRLSPKSAVVREIRRRYAELVKGGDSPEPHVTFDNFSSEAIGKAVESFLTAERESLRMRFADLNIWYVDGFSTLVVVFYQTDQDVQDNVKNGESARVSEDIRKSIASYDEFAYSEREPPDVRFDSKQALDQKYSGNLFYYWR